MDIVIPCCSLARSPGSRPRSWWPLAVSGKGSDFSQSPLHVEGPWASAYLQRERHMSPRKDRRPKATRRPPDLGQHVPTSS